MKVYLQDGRPTDLTPDRCSDMARLRTDVVSENASRRLRRRQGDLTALEPVPLPPAPPVLYGAFAYDEEGDYYWRIDSADDLETGHTLRYEPLR